MLTTATNTTGSQWNTLGYSGITSDTLSTGLGEFTQRTGNEYHEHYEKEVPAMRRRSESAVFTIGS